MQLAIKASQHTASLISHAQELDSFNRRFFQEIIGMKLSCNLLFLLLPAAVLLSTAFCCNYERMATLPRYKDITTPKKVFNLPNPHGICVADNGIFAVMFHVKNGFFHLYYSCGKLMKVVRLPPGYGRMLDCTFSGSDLYLTDHGGKKIYKYTPNGKFSKS